MTELQQEKLVFTFPAVHPAARLTITFQRTLRIPDDGRDYPLPPGFGGFPLRHVDDYAASVDPAWVRHGGIMLPMFQSEAMWLSFEADEIPDRGAEYPFAIKIATGKINAVSGGKWSAGLHRRPRQDYLVSSKQPWLDGYCVEKGIIRQFVAMPLGAGYTAEEQLTGKAEHGGLQILVCPMKRAAFERRFPKIVVTRTHEKGDIVCESPQCNYSSMGLAPGGRMRQEIAKDPYMLADWDTRHTGRTFVHIADSLRWRQITGERPPTLPPTAFDYNQAGMPWFDWYDERVVPLVGSQKLASMKSVAALARRKRQKVLPENKSVKAPRVVTLRRGRGKRVARKATA